MSVKLDMYFIHSTTLEIHIHFPSYCAKLSSCLKYIKVRMALHLLICLYGFILTSSFGSRSEWPRALQLLIKMLIRRCLMWEGLVLLYRNFVFKVTYTLSVRAVILLTTSLCYSVDGEVISSIGRGLCILLGISRHDGPKEIEYM